MVDATGGPQGTGRSMPDPGFREAVTDAGIDLGDFIAGMKEAREQGIKPDMPPGAIHSFKDLMMPALVRVGAVTERTRELFAEKKIPIYEDASTLERLESDDTGAADLDRV
jgi:hypothetical protein